MESLITTLSPKAWDLVKKAKRVSRMEYKVKLLMTRATEFGLDVTDVQIAKWCLQNEDDDRIIDSAYKYAFKLFPHNAKLTMAVAYRFAPPFQVNHTIFWTGEETYRITGWSSDGYKGWLTDTVYEGGCDQTNWGEFVGTYDECLKYIKAQGKS